MTPWRDCAPCHSQPDGARLPLTRHPAYGTSPPTRANSVREGHSLPTACRIPPAMAARPPSSCRCGCLAPPSSPSIGIWLGPFAFPYPSSMVSTTRTSRFGGFGLRITHRMRRTNPGTMADFTTKSATLHPLGSDLGAAAITAQGVIAPKMAEFLMNSANQAKGQCGRVAPHYVTGIGRTNESINKAEDAGRIDAQIRSTDALRRVLPTGLTGYL